MKSELIVYWSRLGRSLYNLLLLMRVMLNEMISETAERIEEIRTRHRNKIDVFVYVNMFLYALLLSLGILSLFGIV